MQRASYCPKEKAAHVGCGYYRYKRRMAMTLDLSPPCKNETLKRNPRGEAVTKHLSVTCWEYSVVNYWSLTSSGWLGDGRCQKAGGQTCWPGQTGDPACEKCQPERFGATSAQRRICLLRRPVFFCQSDLDALGEKHLNRKSHCYSLTRLNF